MAEEVKKQQLNASVAPENFDWDSFENQDNIYGGESKEKIEEAYDQTLSNVVDGYVNQQEGSDRQHRIQERGRDPGS